ncbi:hypothetical protein GGTG_07484 [Gaeumannomyces tritici R3-111a-1]|uniref:Uncharacterized protein n=1 Tax=Gaeumannomyces tritici (strain R3-111a-1) TaxID=644352 RepID=J3P1T6_GAET3|nr:hypothetical protein GGTG_07484 [Gaeumannomyces tritici R3-111a-1]EJT73628.1 hypothetical protein GGTG_07484 [Gaeumannomyces tritici R3-111a-1]
MELGWGWDWGSSTVEETRHGGADGGDECRMQTLLAKTPYEIIFDETRGFEPYALEVTRQAWADLGEKAPASAEGLAMHIALHVW